ncbi:hypothetical protein PIA91_04115 [Klebsiella michiganensis]|uniref:hypothetical protein n=1 Tax=Klebsiella michiganensis TaxID=1134687 RepID=UPI0022479AFD|nr:hypothetical protein [Klebsiella michiganensis]MCW9463082.1 hypothetical protein [Klebsiella michiganensis]MDD9627956.1 hypothetical protein [Klebsiella michiganensis]MDD9633831.1 hypothetical protein [Klebsiella michiganensis]MDD9645218.1 hypothetical protein [Klebsiella michiganensis]MDD9659950.1 hypothetical protein [Klebsiella michiganensis]
MKKEKTNDLKGQELPSVKEALRVWNNYHSRVRNDRNYSTVTICDEWYLFSNFYYWYIDNIVDGWHLDKDILGGNEYSPDNCIFVPREVNQLFRKVPTSLSTGVVVNHKGYQAQAKFGKRVYKFGTYPTIEEAHAAYFSGRKSYIYKLSQKYKAYPKLSLVLLQKSK